MEILVSVIVPAYHVACYIEKCVLSILNQTYRHLEIILVDDGSVDDETGEIVDKLARRDSRIKVLHKKNGGLVSARKAGLAAASGEFVLNVDGDDWIESNMIDELVQAAWKYDADVVTSGLCREEENHQVMWVDTIPEGVYTKEDSEDKRNYFFEHFILNNNVTTTGVLPSVCCKLMRKCLIERILPMLDDCVFWAEDAAVSYSCCVIARRVVITYNTYYHYVMRPTSLVHSTHPHFLKSLSEVQTCIDYFAQKSPYYIQIKKQLDAFVAKDIFNFGASYGQLSRETLPPAYYFKGDSGIPRGAKLALYGAGEVGQSYFRQIKAEKQYEIVIWVDKAYEKFQEKNVRPVEDLKLVDIDYIVVAVADAKVAADIRVQLSENQGINPSQIIWSEPGNFLDRYVKLP